MMQTEETTRGDGHPVGGLRRLQEAARAHPVPVRRRAVRGAGGARVGGTERAVALLAGPDLPVLHGDDLCGHRHLRPHDRRGGVLRCRAPHPSVLQRHGGGRRLDERGVVHQPGRRPVPARLHRVRRAGGWARVRPGLERRLLPGGAARRALPAAHGALHGARLLPATLWRTLAAPAGGAGSGAVFLHLRGGADLRHRPDRFAPDGRAVRDRHPARAGRGAALLVPGRHARDHLDAGGAVRDPAAGVPHPRLVARVQAAGQPAGAAGLRRAAAQDHRAGKGADRLAGGEAGAGRIRAARGEVPRLAGRSRNFVATRARRRAGTHPPVEGAERRLGAHRGRASRAAGAAARRRCRARAMDPRHAGEPAARQATGRPGAARAPVRR